MRDQDASLSGADAISFEQNLPLPPGRYICRYFWGADTSQECACSAPFAITGPAWCGLITVQVQAPLLHPLSHLTLFLHFSPTVPHHSGAAIRWRATRWACMLTASTEEKISLSSGSLRPGAALQVPLAFELDVMCGADVADVRMRQPRHL